MIFIRFLLISILVLYIIRSLVRLLLPMLFQSMVNKAQQQQNNQSYNSQSRQPEGKSRLIIFPKLKNRFLIPRVILSTTRK